MKFTSLDFRNPYLKGPNYTKFNKPSPIKIGTLLFEHKIKFRPQKTYAFMAPVLYWGGGTYWLYKSEEGHSGKVKFCHFLLSSTPTPSSKCTAEKSGDCSDLDTKNLLQPPLALNHTLA